MKKNYASFTDYATYIKGLLDMYSDVTANIITEIFEVTIREGFIRGNITFVDGSNLRFLEYIRIVKEDIIKLKYRYHYEDSEGKLVFRYDNAPHYRNVVTFPHHKHLADGEVIASHEPSLEKVLAEIIALMK